MKKILSVSELKNSELPKILQEAFGSNLVSVFLHGNCLMEGFDALHSPWTISFILKENSPENIAVIQNIAKEARRLNVTFCYFFCPAEIVKSLDTFPLEYLHISRKSAVLCGIPPLLGYEPHRGALRLQCERELRGALVHLRLEAASQELLEEAPKKASLKKTKKFLQQANNSILPALYGVYFLKTGTYPEHHDDVLGMFPGLSETSANNYIKTVAGIVDEVDSMEEK